MKHLWILLIVISLSGCGQIGRVKTPNNGTTGREIIHQTEKLDDNLDLIESESVVIQDKAEEGRKKAPDLPEFVSIQDSAKRIDGLVVTAKTQVRDTQEVGQQVIADQQRFIEIIEELQQGLIEQREAYESQIAEMEDADSAGFRKLIFAIMAGGVIVLIMGVIAVIGSPYKQMGLSVSLSAIVGIAICMGLLKFQRALGMIGLWVVAGLFLAAVIGLAAVVWIRYRDQIRSGSVYKELVQRFKIAADAKNIEEAVVKVRENRPRHPEADAIVHSIVKPKGI